MISIREIKIGGGEGGGLGKVREDQCVDHGDDRDEIRSAPGWGSRISLLNVNEKKKEQEGILKGETRCEWPWTRK